jgi:hypothetical protein
MLLQLPDAPASAGASASPTAQPFARQNKRQRLTPTGELDAVDGAFPHIRNMVTVCCGKQTEPVQASIAICTWRSAAGPYGDMERGGFEDEARWRAVIESQRLDARQLMVRFWTTAVRFETWGGRHTMLASESGMADWRP